MAESKKKQKVDDKAKKEKKYKLYIGYCKSECNDDVRHIVFSIAPTAQEKLLLDIQALNEIFRPGAERGANSSYALGSYFLHKYAGGVDDAEWKEGNPLDDCDSEDDESQSDSEEAKKKKRTAKQEYVSVYDWVIQAWALDPDSGLTCNGVEEYVRMLKEIVKGEYYDILQAKEAREILDKHPKLRDAIAGLEAKHFDLD